MISLMRLAFLLYFLTLVVVVAEAAPNTDIKPAPIQTKDPAARPSEKSIELEPVQTTEAPTGLFRVGPQRFLSNGSTNLGIGGASGKFDEDKNTEEMTTGHFQRTQYNLDESAQEFGVSVLGNSTRSFIGLDWGWKKFCCFMSFAKSYDPFFKIGFAAIYDPADQLGNIIDYKKYFFQGSIGFDSFLRSRRLIRLEIGGRSGYPGAHAYAALLYAFPD